MAETTEDKAVLQAGAQSAADYEYNTLMRLMRVSVSKHLLDEHFTLVWANDFYYELIGWPKEEYETLFHNRPDLFYADHQKEWKELSDAVMNSLAAHQSGYRLVTTMPRKNGEYVWIQICNSFSEEYINGYQVSYTVMTNIDDLVRMQKEQSVTYDNLPGFVAKFCVDRDEFRLLEANDRFRDFFDCRKKSSLPCGLSNLSTSKNKATLEQNLPSMWEGKPVHFSLQAKNRTGGDVWLQVNADCIDWVNGAPVYLVIYIDITDITEQRELQKQLEERTALLNKALAAAEQANKAKSEFLSRMSHDIRTPMNAIMGMTSIAASHIDDKERIQDCLSKITVSSKLLLGLMNEVLDMSRIESGRISMEEERFSLGEILQNIVTLTQHSMLEKHHSFDIHAMDIQHEQVVGDPQRIEQVFLNILSNAIKYTPDNGSILLEIQEKPSAREEYSCYEFTFRDNGYGMKPDFLNKVFIPFERARDAAVYSIQGTGLGMAISQNIVHMMGGDIRVESVYGEGSTFIVTIQLKLQDSDVAPLRLSDPKPVLVADDDPVVCEMTCKRLNEMGFLSQWVLSGQDAVERVASAHQAGVDFSIIIVDKGMPDMDGVETARRIRAGFGAELPLILISDYDWTEYEAAALEAGAGGFVVKPMLKSNLLSAFRRYALKEENVTAAKAPEPEIRSYDGKRLLLVEDNDLNLEIGVEILSQMGFTVETAQNGLEGSEKFAAAPEGYYSLIFMDLQMPVMDGLEAARKIRDMDKPGARAIPIVAMTANAFAEDIEATRAAGMNAHLTKPLEIDLLRQVLHQYIPADGNS